MIYFLAEVFRKREICQETEITYTMSDTSWTDLSIYIQSGDKHPYFINWYIPSILKNHDITSWVDFFYEE